MYKDCPYVLLPTNTPVAGCILDNGKGYLLGICTQPNYSSKQIQPLHLYILSPDEIKVSEWCYDRVNQIIFQALIPYQQTEDPQYLKIIATTNPYLKHIASISLSDREYVISLHNRKNKLLDVEQLASDEMPDEAGYRGFIEGFNKCSELNVAKKFTLEDMEAFAEWINETSVRLSNGHWQYGKDTSHNRFTIRELSDKYLGITYPTLKMDTVRVDYDIDRTILLIDENDKTLHIKPEIKEGCIVILKN